MEQVETSEGKPENVPSIIRGDENPVDKLNWTQINEHMVYTENDGLLPFKVVYHDVTTIVVFIRHFLCFTAKEYVEDLAKIPKANLEKARVRLVVIGCGEAKHIKQFREDTGYWAEIYTDPKRELYELMGCCIGADLGKVSASKHTKSSLVTGIIKSALRSTAFPGEMQGDHTQLGGAFILGPGEQCQLYHTDKNASDHYPINKLLDAVGVENVAFAKDTGVITV